jgi:sodium transport system ATP-binding protein
MIEAAGLRKRFGDVVAVDDVSFRAEAGAITGILGPNGAGKTTTLRMLCSLIRPDAGSARIDGCDVAEQPEEVRRRIGVLPDVSGLYPRLTAREHVRYFGRLHGFGGGELEGRIERLMQTLDLVAVADRSTQGFSHGERMKVAIARALVHEPRTVLLDEPTNGLDVMSTRTMRGLIHRLRDDGKCVLFSSHIMQEVSALCDVVVVIAKGRVVARGTPAELLESTGAESLEDAFVQAIGSDEGLEK